MAAKTLTVKEAAQQIGTDARTLRKFLRHEVTQAGGKVGEDTPGKGGRYSLEARQMKGLTARFQEWAEAKQHPAPEVEEQTEPGDSNEGAPELEVELD
jgi:hypothetical protein